MLCIALVHLLAARDHEIQTLSVELQFESRVARSLLAEKETEIQGMRDTQSEPQEGKEVPILHEFHIGSNYLDIEFDEFFPLSLVDPKTVALCPWYPNRDCRDNGMMTRLIKPAVNDDAQNEFHHHFKAFINTPNHMLCVRYPPLQIALVHLLAARDHKLRTLSVEPQEGKEVLILHEFHIGTNYLDIEFDEFFPLSSVDLETEAFCPWYPNCDCRDNG
ncbi:hypothetical protein Tco_1115975 [Tanacetum coccineum]